MSLFCNNFTTEIYLTKTFLTMNMNAAHWHLIMNHIPIVGSFFASLLLIFGLLRKSNSVILTSYWFFILLGIFAFIGYLSDAGLADDKLITPHAQAAQKAALTLYAAAVLSLIALFVKSLKTSRAMPVIILLVSLAGSGLMAWTGMLGGEIMHKEIRPGFVAPAANKPKTQ